MQQMGHAPQQAVGRLRQLTPAGTAGRPAARLAVEAAGQQLQLAVAKRPRGQAWRQAWGGLLAPLAAMRAAAGRAVAAVRSGWHRLLQQVRRR
jgi:hypothetical protein